MNNLLNRPRFSGAVLTKLVGITEGQFLSLRNSGLMTYKHRYSLQDVFFVAFCNDFRVRANKSWLSIIKLFVDVFSDVETARNLDFLNNDVLTIRFKDVSNDYRYLSISNPFIRLVVMESGYHNPEDFKSFCFTIDDMESCYINLLKIRLTVINRAKKLDLKVDVENILLSA